MRDSIISILARLFFFFQNAPEPGSTSRGYTARARARLKFVSTSLRSSVFALVTSKGGGRFGFS